MTYCLGGSRSIHLSYGDEVCILLPFNDLTILSSWYTQRVVQVGVHVRPVFIVPPSTSRPPVQPVT